MYFCEVCFNNRNSENCAKIFAGMSWIIYEQLCSCVLAQLRVNYLTYTAECNKVK